MYAYERGTQTAVRQIDIRQKYPQLLWRFREPTLGIACCACGYSLFLFSTLYISLFKVRWIGQTIHRKKLIKIVFAELLVKGFLNLHTDVTMACKGIAVS